MGWDLSDDTFQLGQWMKGRIHGYCCDLSPDGGYFVYDVVRASAGEYETWTAISHAPYLKAIGRWKVSAGLPGGGLFLAEDRCWLHNAWDAHQECEEITQELTEVDDELGRDCRKVYIRRQLRDGWKFHSKVGDVIGLEVYRFEKPVGENRVLRNIFDDTERLGLQRGSCPSEYELVDFATGEVQLHPTWEWADSDGNRLLWAEGGKIFSANIEAQGLGSGKMLYDFNDMTFQAIEAPY